MQKRLHKTDRISVRFTPRQARDIQQATRLESERRGEVVGESSLVRELVLAGVERILADHADQAA